MLIRSLPAMPANDAEFQKWFHSRWGQENCIIWGRTCHADFGPLTHTLSIRAAWHGTERIYINGRTVAIDDDNFLILNHGRVYSTSIRAASPVESLAICFRPGLAGQIQADISASMERALHHGDSAPHSGELFLESLHPHERSVSSVLRFIRAHLKSGLVDEAWYEEQLIFLLARMHSHREHVLNRMDRLALVRPAKRREVYRRIALATDFLHTQYAQDVDLGTLASIAYLSKYHFLRLFSLVHGITPHAYLQRKRTSVAVRLLESTQLTVNEVAARVGFAEKSTLQRQLRRWMKLTPYQIRARAGKGRRFDQPSGQFECVSS